MKEQSGKEQKRRESLSKTRLRMTGSAGEADKEKRMARILEMFPETPKEVDDIIFNVSSEPRFPPEKSSDDPPSSTPKSD